MTEPSGDGNTPPDRRDLVLVPLDPAQMRRDNAAMGQQVGTATFVGRGDSLDVLHLAFERAASGTPSMVLVEGEAGMGKSRLVSEFCSQLTPGRAVVATGSCVPIDDGGLPFAPVIGILRSLARRAIGGSAATVGSLVDQLAAAGAPTVAAAPVGDRGGLYEEVAKSRVFEAILDLLSTTADQQPLVLVFEDLHWADSASAELLHFLTRNLTDTAVLLIGTYRAEDLGAEPAVRRRMSELGRHATVTSVHLPGLERNETARLIGEIIGAVPDWALVDAVWARSEGNPFLAEELTAARHDPSLSPKLRDVVLSRVDGVSPEAGQLLQLVAAAGAAVDHRLAAAVSPLDTDALDRACSELLDRQLMLVDGEAGSYRLRHALLREAVYAALLPGERDRLHRRFAAVLVDDPSVGAAGAGQRAAELAAHWWAAGEWAEARTASIASARAASDLWAFPEALAHLERALVALDRMVRPAVADRLEVLEQAAETAFLASETDRALELADAAIELVDATADPLRAARLLLMSGRCANAAGDPARGFAAFLRAAEVIPAGTTSVEGARAIAYRASFLMVECHLAESKIYCIDAIEAARAAGAQLWESHALNTLGCDLAMEGDVDAGLAYLRQSIEIAKALGDPDALNRGYGNLSSVLLDSGRLEEAAASAAAFAAAFNRGAVGQKWGISVEGAANNAAEALHRLGRWDEADALIDRIGVRGIGACRSGVSMLRTAIQTRRGNLDHAAVLLATVDEDTTGFNDLGQRGWFHMLAGELALDQGSPVEAHEQVVAGLAIAGATGDEDFTPELCAHGVRALADQYEGSPATQAPGSLDELRRAADDLVRRAEEAAGARVERGFPPAPRGLGWALTTAAEQTRLDQPDPERWSRAAEQWAIAREPYQEGYARLRMAEALVHDGTARPAAARALHDADRIARHIGAQHLVEQVELLARRSRIPLLPAATEGAGEGRDAAADLGLTPREAEVLVQLALGHTDRDIAQELFISKKTASVHVSNLIRKLGVPNRVEAGRIGQANLARLPVSSRSLAEDRPA